MIPNEKDSNKSLLLNFPTSRIDEKLDLNLEKYI